MIVLIVLAAIAAAIVLVIAWRSMVGARPVDQELLELGTIAVPARLQPRPAEERPERVVFRFDRAAGGFTMMGSFTPIQEQLVVGVWPDGPSVEARRSFRHIAQERVEEVEWRSSGDWEIGTGVHRVNMHETPAVVLMRALPEHGMALGYMAWIEDASLEEAKARLEKIAASYEPAMGREEFFAVVGDRPGKIRAERRAHLARELSARGVTLDADERPVERDGIAYVLSPRWGHHEEAWFFAMTPIGSLPSSTRSFRHHRPEPPEGLWAWPDIVYYAWQDGGWQRHNIDRNFEPPPALDPWIEGQLVDRTRTYFFAVHGIAVDDTDPTQFGLELLWQAPPHMRSLLEAGELVYPLD